VKPYYEVVAGFLMESICQKPPYKSHMAVLNFILSRFLFKRI